MTCARKVCDHEIPDLFIRIWNQPHCFPAYRDYCEKCGINLVELHRTLEYEVHDSRSGKLRIGDLRFTLKINNVKEMRILHDFVTNSFIRIADEKQTGNRPARSQDA